jgi:hypothetical protein
MFKPGSLQRDYTLCSEYDSALDLPEVADLAEDASEESIAARNAAIEERARRLRVARERGEWATIIKPGGKPTLFHFRHIPGSALDWWHGKSEQLGTIAGYALLFRLALKGVENLGSLEMKFDEIDGQRVLSDASIDQLYALQRADGTEIGRAIVGELGRVVAQKTFRGVSPLS